MRLKALALITIATMFFAAASGSAADPVVAQSKLEKLMNPAQLNETAPEKFQAKFDTSKGEFIIEVTRTWAPIGADRFYNLVKNGYYDNCRFFRVLNGFMAQFGIHGNPKVAMQWYKANIKDDPVKESNTRGYVTYAKANTPNSRSTQLFINFGNNSSLDRSGFAPIGKVTKGMDVVDSIYSGYGEAAPSGSGPEQSRIIMEGNAYLEKSFPKLDYIKSATIVPGE
jgi:peptidyl-prolyl cis-trans isomerase A (cyclophilin A)